MAATVSAAEAVADAEARLAELRERLGAGDPTVSAEMMDRAGLAVRFAVWQRDAVAAHEARAAERERQARLEALRRDLPTRLDPAPLEKARAELTAAVEAFVAACREYDDRHGAAYGELTDPTLEPLSGDLSLDRHHMRVLIRVGDRQYGPARPQLWLSAAANDALARHYPRTMRSLDRPQD